MQIVSVLFIYSKPRMNNICIYAEVIALARFFLGLLLSPQTLNIQLPSPDLELGVQSCLSLAFSRQGEVDEQGNETSSWCVWAVGARAPGF